MFLPIKGYTIPYRLGCIVAYGKSFNVETGEVESTSCGYLPDTVGM
jgi:hypothetical protein